LKETGGAPEIVFLATGSEVGVALAAAKNLVAEGRRVRVVSLPCREVFARQDAAYRAAILPKDGRRVSIEAGRTGSWPSLTGTDGLNIAIDHFGASAPAPVLAEKFGFTPAAVTASVKAWLAG